MSEIIMEYMKTPLYRHTFRNARIRQWVEQNCEGYVLNLFCGPTRLAVDEIRNDLGEDIDADTHLDAFDFVNGWEGAPFDTVVLDPPYSYRKSMEMYGGRMASRFNLVKDGLSEITSAHAKIITFGYHSVSMGEARGFVQEKILVMSHGGAIHDTIAVVERKHE